VDIAALGASIPGVSATFFCGWLNTKCCGILWWNQNVGTCYEGSCWGGICKPCGGVNEPTCPSAPLPTPLAILSLASSQPPAACPLVPHLPDLISVDIAAASRHVLLLGPSRTHWNDLSLLPAYSNATSNARPRNQACIHAQPVLPVHAVHASCACKLLPHMPHTTRSLTSSW
jgi:hypothetical protein